MIRRERRLYELDRDIALAELELVKRVNSHTTGESALADPTSRIRLFQDRDRLAQRLDLLSGTVLERNDASAQQAQRIASLSAELEKTKGS